MWVISYGVTPDGVTASFTGTDQGKQRPTHSAGVSYRLDTTWLHVDSTACAREYSWWKPAERSISHGGPNALQWAQKCDVLFGSRRYLCIHFASLFYSEKSWWLFHLLMKSSHDILF